MEWVWILAFREITTDKVKLYSYRTLEAAERGYADAVRHGLGVDFPHTISPMLVPGPRKGGE